jgi:hypothetical protein
MKKHKKLFITLSAIGGVIILSLGAFFIYTGIYYHAVVVEKYLEDSETVDVEENSSTITFTPLDSTATTGFIFYPCAKVEAKAYAPLMRQLAEDNIYTVIVKMPFNLAMFGINKASDVLSSTEGISSWYIGGHSLGGAMCANYLANNVDKYDGLVLLASYSTQNLSSSGLKVASIVGTNDQVVNRSNLEKYKSNLPEDTKFVDIEGGNHGQFASYGHQSGDGEATISTLEQIAQTKEIIEELINA